MSENWSIRIPIKDRIPPTVIGLIRREAKAGNKLYLYYHAERFMARPYGQPKRSSTFSVECVGWLEISPVPIENYQTRTWDNLRREQERYQAMLCAEQQKRKSLSFDSAGDKKEDVNVA